MFCCGDRSERACESPRGLVKLISVGRKAWKTGLRMATLVLKGELAGLRRIRVGVYRVVYEMLQDVLVILVVRIGHRREGYR